MSAKFSVHSNQNRAASAASPSGNSKSLQPPRNSAPGTSLEETCQNGRDGVLKHESSQNKWVPNNSRVVFIDLVDDDEDEEEEHLIRRGTCTNSTPTPSNPQKKKKKSPPFISAPEEDKDEEEEHSISRGTCTISTPTPSNPSRKNKKSPPSISPPAPKKNPGPCILNTTGEDNAELSSRTRSQPAIMPNRYPIYRDDISRGEELIKIPLINNLPSSKLRPSSILYNITNTVYKNAHVDFSLARLSDDNCCSSCHGDCLESDLPCGCAAETGGEFAYTKQGLLNEEFLDKCLAMWKLPEKKHYSYCEKVCPLSNDLSKKGKKVNPCKGHLSRKFIKECWRKCGCSKWCGNRVVQKGIRVPLQVFAASEEKGWGVRSTRPLKKGTFICEYIGEIVTNKERAAKNEVHTYPVLLDADWGSEKILKDEEALCLDATEFGNVGRFINHRCEDANLIEMPVEIESPDHHYYHVAFFTVRDVEAMEELTWDYGIEFDDIYHPIKAFKCKCGSKQCRDKKKSLN
ncbi:Histone-lysine N-methyltransferase SUVR4 [Linum perenne]